MKDYGRVSFSFSCIACECYFLDVADKNNSVFYQSTVSHAKPIKVQYNSLTCLLKLTTPLDASTMQKVLQRMSELAINSGDTQYSKQLIELNWLAAYNRTIKHLEMKYPIVLIFLFYQLSCTGQTIRKFLVDDYKVKDSTISEFVEAKTYFEKSRTSTYKRTYYVNPKGFIKEIVGFNLQGKLSTRISYDYDHTGKLLQLKEEYWSQSVGYSVITNNFYYDKSGWSGIEIIGNDGKVTSKSTVLSKNGYPIKMTSYDWEGSLLGDEIADYNYDGNEVIIKVLNNQGKLIGTPFVLKMNLRKEPNFEVAGTVTNEYGDIIQELKPKCLSCDELMTYSYEYKYDKSGNWISKVTYGEEDGKKVKMLKELREIKYRN